MALLRFSRGMGRAAACVRWATASEYAQVGFKLDSGLVLDATPDLGVMIRDAVDDETTAYFEFTAPKAHISAAASWAHSQVGAPFDWSAAFWWRRARDWRGDETKWFPSELVCAAFMEARWSLVRDGQNFSRITPRDLLLSTRVKPFQREGSVGQ
jgi:uncharacterized protein YycO